MSNDLFRKVKVYTVEAKQLSFFMTSDQTKTTNTVFTLQSPPCSSAQCQSCPVSGTACSLLPTDEHPLSLYCTGY